MPSDHFQDFDPEVVEPEPPTPEAQKVLDRLSSADTPPEKRGQDALQE